MKRTYIVYLHKCLVTKTTNGIYIGITSTNTSRRWNNGKGYLQWNKDKNNYAQPKMAYTIIKHGIENWNNELVWQHKILATNKTKEEAECLEIRLIAMFDSYYSGLNSTKGGGGYLKYDTEEERQLAKALSVEAAHKTWAENSNNLIKDREYRHKSYLKAISDPNKYAKRLAQKKKANLKRRSDPIKAAKDKKIKQESQKKLRKQISFIRSKIIKIWQLDNNTLSAIQYNIVFAKNGSHYKYNSITKLTNILKEIQIND